MLRITAKNIVALFFVIVSISQSCFRAWPDFPVAVHNAVRTVKMTVNTNANITNAITTLHQLFTNFDNLPNRIFFS